MKKKHKSYAKPKRPFDKERIDEEKGIVKEFGLKNKQEIWKAEAKIKNIRKKAKKLISSDKDKQDKLFEKLNEIGMKVSSISDVLSLTKTDFLERRLQTLVYKKKLAPTVKTSRQLITHKKVSVNDRIIDVPSYIVPAKFEKLIKIKPKKDVSKNE